MPQKIGGQLSTEVVEFQPQGGPAWFEVTVLNLSEQFASFKVDLQVAGADPNLGDRWYKLDPEVSTKKPPGDKTEFRVTILESPIPGVELINVVVQVSSLEFRDILRHSLRLRVKPGLGPALVQLELPIRHFPVYPRQTAQILVRVRNPNSQPVDTILQLAGIPPNWLLEGAERRVLVGPGQQSEAVFVCQSPIATQAPSGNYPFTVTAYAAGQAIGSVSGMVEVLPIGRVLFTAEPQQAWLPARASLWPQRRCPPANYLLQFKNASNLQQGVSVEAQPRDRKKYAIDLHPPQGQVKPGERLDLNLQIKTRRPWWGLARKRLISAVAALTDQRLGNTDPDSQTLELYLRPVLPPWLQALLLLLLLLLLALLLLLLQTEHHTGPVTAVRFNGPGETVLSGSQDETVRRWQVSPDSFSCRWFGWQSACLNAKGKLLDNSAEGTDGKAVSTLRFRAETSDVIAVGLENGEIQLRNVRTQRREQQFSQQKSDRVFDLVFSKDSFNLFSGHGKFLRHWRLEGDQAGSPEAEIDRNFAIYALALNKSPDPALDEKYLVLAGRYNQIQLWEWKAGADQFYAMDYPQGTANDYITSVATGIENRLVTADTKGRVQVWNLKPCLNLATPVAPAVVSPASGAAPTATLPAATTPMATALTQPPTGAQCKAELLDSWQLTYDNGLPMPLRSIALSKDEPYLAAVGDDGVIRLWKMGQDGKRQPGFADAGREIARHPRALNSVDLIVRGQNLLIVTGCADNQVRLNIFPLN